MTEREERIPNYIDYPYDVFIKLRLEFLLICQDEIEAKVMRIIEKAIEDKRKNLYRILVNKTPKGEEVHLPEQIWVAISHTFFLDRLYGTVQSENTLKAALKSLADKKLIRRRAGGNRPYDAQEYTLNKPLIQEKLAELPLLDELNVMSMMKQPRKPRKPRKTVETESQSLRVSKFDTLDDTLDNESEGQSLIPQSINDCPPGVSNFDTNEGQSLIPLPRYTDSNLDNTKKEENALSSIDETRTLSRPLVFHPLHDFIALDDAIAPKEMVVFMTPEKYFSEYEDKRRGRIADEVHHELQQRGHHVTFKWEQELESNYKFAPEVVDASSSNSSPSITDEAIPSQAPSFEQRDTTAPLSEENGTTEPALPEFASQAQEKATGQGNEQSTKQEALLIVESDTGKTSSGKGKKTTAKPEKPAKPAKVELTTEFANDDERAMWEKLDAKERTFYARMNTRERALYAQWCSLFKAHQTLGEAMFNACRKIAPASPTSEAMKDAKKWLFDNDNKTEKYPKGFYHTVGVQLWHLAEKWPAWETLQEQAEAQKQSAADGQKSALAQESGITRPELYRPAEDNNPRREAALNRQWIDPKKRNRRTFGNEAS